MPNPGQPSQSPVYPKGGSGAPRLLLELEPRWPSFWRNLADFLLRRQPPPITLTSRPGTYWSDVFVASPLPRRPLAASGLYHVALALVLYALPSWWLLSLRPPPGSQPLRPLLSYYDVSEYLPPVNSGSAPAKVAQKGRPAYAKQVIISAPEHPDNFSQTIIDPSTPIKLAHNVPMPNLVIWTPVPAAPVAASAGRAHLTLPVMPVTVVAPPPAPGKREAAQLNLPKLPQAAVVEPPPPDSGERKIAELNIGHFDVRVAAPKLPVEEQRAGAANGSGEPNAAPPAGQASGSGMQAAGQLLALGLNPVEPNGKLYAPGGNRSGEFAAGPNGTPGAPGTLDRAGGGNGNGGTGTGTQGGLGSGAGGAIPGGVYVGPGAYNPGPAAVVAKVPSAAPPAGAGHPGSSPTRNALLAAAAPPRLADVPRNASVPAPSSPSHSAGGKIEDEVFGGKKYYQMILNMPNLTSAGGSWVMRFAELRDDPRAGDLTAPVALDKVDPAYPNQLIKDGVEGTVILYAVIRADGSVADVKVLRGVDDRLDENARLALLRWRFRPATKNGLAVDLEAVVQIPFVIGKKISY
jgi:protein TonB